MKADFSGYATKNGLKCSDGRTILAGAFKHHDKTRVPLVWQHQHDDVDNVLGHAILEHRDDGVYAYGYFNETPAGKNARNLVEHGDIVALSIYANNLREQNKLVQHGNIREVSLVLSGANPGAFIDNINIQHAADGGELIEAVIYTGHELEHKEGPDMVPSNTQDQNLEHAEKTVADIFNAMSDEQKNVVYFMIGTALEEKGGSVAQSSTSTDENDDIIQHSQEDPNMARNVFDQSAADTALGVTLSHSQIKQIFDDAEKIGSFKDSMLAHAVEYGIENIDLLFPDAQSIANSPEFVSRRMEWVSTFLNGTNKVPFSRIKSLSADITHDEARAKGYVKATLKKEEWFGLTKRVTTPTTIYKKQKLDRDDIIDVTTLDVVAWLKAEMRVMLDEEVARAGLIGDGREVDDPDKVLEPSASASEGKGIRSIAHDHEFYSHKVTVPANVSGDAMIEAILRARPAYRGAGNPVMFTTEEVLTDLILIKDKMGRRLYPTQNELESALRVSSIVTVPVMEGETTDQGDLLAILVNLRDYTYGADKGGNVSMFEDFDIDFNQEKYLIETRVSGALTKYKTAIVISRANATLVTPTVPTFTPATGVVSIPTVTGVTYYNQETDAVLTAGNQTALAVGATLSVVAKPNTGYAFPHLTDADWDFTRPSA